MFQPRISCILISIIFFLYNSIKKNMMQFLIKTENIYINYKCFMDLDYLFITHVHNLFNKKYDAIFFCYYYSEIFKLRKIRYSRNCFLCILFTVIHIYLIKKNLMFFSLLLIKDRIIKI